MNILEGVSGVTVFFGDSKTAVTDQNGYYAIPRLRDAVKAYVTLDPDTVPALYTVTNGTQMARVYNKRLTEVNLSLAPLISISSHVMVTELQGELSPVAGVRVTIKGADSGRLVTDSYTAEDGSYYLGDVQPGAYVLEVDASTLPADCVLADPNRPIEVAPTRDEFQEIELPDFTAIRQEPPTSQ